MTTTTTTTTLSLAQIVWEITSRPCSNRRSPDTAPRVRASCEEINCTEYHSALLDQTEYDLDNFPDPTPDAMIAFLRKRCAFVTLSLSGDGPILLEYKHPEGFHAFASARTIREVLTAAVLVQAVAR